jgi:hypothetical protein
MTISLSVDLAQRIIEAARIAAAMHLEAESSPNPSVGGADADAGSDRPVRQDLELAAIAAN